MQSFPSYCPAVDADLSAMDITKLGQINSKPSARVIPLEVIMKTVLQFGYPVPQGKGKKRVGM